MNILGFFNMTTKTNETESGVGADAAPAPAPASARRPDSVERRILRDFADKLAVARTKVAMAEAAIERLEGVILDGERADAALQTAVAADGAAALQALVAGSAAPDAAMVAAVTAEIAARAARSALPGANAALEAAKAEAMQMEAERNIAATNALKVEADKVAAKYARAWGQLCVLHDTLLVISGALPALRREEQTIHNLTTTIEAPRFNLPSNTSSAGGWSPIFRHIPSYDYAIPPVTARWNEALERLLGDPNADVEDLISETA